MIVPDNKSGRETTQPPRPEPSFTMMTGIRNTGAMRVRASWFGFAVLEEQIEHRDGTRKWRRAWPRSVEF